MPFDINLAAQIATVSAAFSSAAQALIGLQSLKDKVSDEEREGLNRLIENLSSLSQAGEALREAKKLHDCLNRVMPHAHRVKAVYNEALSNRIFQEDSYDVGRACERWSDTFPDFLVLQEFLTLEMQLIAQRVDGEGAGAPWARQMLNQYKTVDTIVERRTRGDRIDKQVLAEEINKFVRLIETQMSLANRAIRESSETISSGFLKLEEQLRHVRF